MIRRILVIGVVMAAAMIGLRHAQSATGGTPFRIGRVRC